MRWLIVSSMMLGGGIIIWLVPTNQGIARRISPLEIIPHVIDLGTLAPRESAEKTIRLMNHSARSIRLANLRHSCACTQVHFSSDQIAPSSETLLLIRFRPVVLGGRQTFEVQFDTIDTTGTTRTHTIRGHADVMPLFELDPSHLQLNEMQIGESQEHKVQIRYLRPVDRHEILLANAGDEWQWSVASEPIASNTLRAKLRFTPQRQSGLRNLKLADSVGSGSTEPCGIERHSGCGRSLSGEA